MPFQGHPSGRPPRATHNQTILQVRRWFLTDSKLTERARARFIHIHLIAFLFQSGRQFVIATPRICSFRHTWQSFGRRSGVQWFTSDARIALHARICRVMLMDDSSGVGQLRSISWIAGSLKPCTHYLALAMHLVSVSFQRRTRREEITRSRCFFSDHIRLRGVHDGHRLEIEYSLPFGFDCFRKLCLLFGRKVVPRHPGVPWT